MKTDNFLQLSKPKKINIFIAILAVPFYAVTAWLSFVIFAIYYFTRKDTIRTFTF